MKIKNPPQIFLIRSYQCYSILSPLSYIKLTLSFSVHTLQVEDDTRTLLELETSSCSVRTYRLKVFFSHWHNIKYLRCRYRSFPFDFKTWLTGCKWERYRRANSSSRVSLCGKGKKWKRKSFQKRQLFARVVSCSPSCVCSHKCCGITVDQTRAKRLTFMWMGNDIFEKTHTRLFPLIRNPSYNIHGGVVPAEARWHEREQKSPSVLIRTNFISSQVSG